MDLYTPIIKGWLTELAQEVTSLAVQVHGGMGYVEETGVARHFRDARILPIYEGTNGIQAMDLVGRKTLANEGALLAELLDDIDTTSATCARMRAAAGWRRRWPRRWQLHGERASTCWKVLQAIPRCPAASPST